MFVKSYETNNCCDSNKKAVCRYEQIMWRVHGWGVELVFDGLILADAPLHERFWISFLCAYLDSEGPRGA